MKRVFKVYINGNFTQYLKPSEVRLIKWEEGLRIELVAVLISEAAYKANFG